MSLTELSRKLELDRSTIGRNVKVLQRRGLVVLQHGADGRESLVRLSEDGAAVRASAEPLWTAAQDAIEKKLGPVAAAAFMSILQTFA